MKLCRLLMLSKAVHREACKSNQDNDWDRLQVAKQNVCKFFMQKKHGYVKGILVFRYVQGQFWREIHKRSWEMLSLMLLCFVVPTLS